MSWLSLRQEQEQKIRQEAMLGMMLELGLMLEGHFDFGNGWHPSTRPMASLPCARTTAS